MEDVRKKGITAAKLSASCLFIIAIIMTASALNYTKAMMIPFAIALFFSLVLQPTVSYLQEKVHLPRMMAVIFVMTLIIVTLLLFTQMIKNTVVDVLSGIDIYQQRLARAVDSFIETPLAAVFDLQREHLYEVVRSIPFLQYVQNITGQAMSLLSNTMLVMIFVFFLLSGVNKATHTYSTPLAMAIDLQIRRYLLTKVITSLLTAALVGMTLGLLDVDLAVMFTVFTFLLNFIPTIGAIIATLLPIPVVLLQFDSYLPIVLAIVIPAIIQLLIGVVEPKILGRNLDLHPATILLSLMFWGIIWGVVGMFLAVPIMAAIKLILERFEATRFLSDLMSGRMTF